MTRRTGVLAVLAIVTALALLYVVRTDRLPGPAAVATPAPSGAASPVATSTAGASPSSTPAATDRYGYVFTSPSGSNEERIVVWRESDGKTLFDLAGIYPAVSPDGKHLAYWRTTRSGDICVGRPCGVDLRVLDVVDPTTDHSVFTVGSDSIGGATVWSNDGLGLLVETHSRETVGVGGVEGGNPARYDLLMLDLATTPPAARAAAEPVSRGEVLVPVAWDRPGKAAAGVVTGPGGYATGYVTWNGNAAQPFARTFIPPYGTNTGWNSSAVLAFQVTASDDAKLVMAFESNLTVLRVWPILDIANAGEVRAPSRIFSAIWRPGASAPYEVVWAFERRLDLFRYRTDQSTTLYTSPGTIGVLAIRPDGSGVLMAEYPPAGATMPPPPTSTTLRALDFATRQPRDVVTVTGGTPHVLRRGVLLR
ncbi:MAG: hypothetical protein ACRDF0_05945 [Candidatus Limnocylindria bacterium]